MKLLFSASMRASAVFTRFTSAQLAPFLIVLHQWTRSWPDITSVDNIFLTRLKTHLYAESLLWHCYAVVFSLNFWCPRALGVGRHSKFMLIYWLIEYVMDKEYYSRQSHNYCICHPSNTNNKLPYYPGTILQSHGLPAVCDRSPIPSHKLRE